MNIKIKPCLTIFGSSEKVFYNNKNKITEKFNDDDVLIKRIEYDEFDRFIDSKDFDVDGSLSQHHHFDYNEEGFVETFKNRESEYIRKSKTFIKNSYRYRIEKYISTNSKNNYVHEFITSLSGKLLRMTCNGKIILDLIKKEAWLLEKSGANR